jgi:hypothetical protein
MMVVLLAASETEPSIQSAAMTELARLGVTSIVLVADERTVGLVLEGWAFDPSTSADAAVAAFAASGSAARTLYPVAEMAVSNIPLPRGGGTS